jgi:FkbM family methyltransferase
MQSIKRVMRNLPVIGPPLRQVYRRVRFNDGEIILITSGPLAGYRYRRYIGADITPYIQGDNEQDLTTALCQSLKPGATFFDIGANGGYFCLLASTLVGPTGKVIAFEPHPEFATYARRQVAVNELSNCRIIEHAIADEPGHARLTRDAAAGNHLDALAPSSGPLLNIQTTTLDEAVHQLGVPDVIKIDIEGAEMLALQGGRNLLTSHDPCLFVELHTRQLYEQYLEFMNALGYTTTTVSGDRINDSTGPSPYTRFVKSSRHGVRGA